MTGRPADLRLAPIGHVESALTARADAPRQADEGAPPARLAIDAEHRPAMEGIRPGDRIVVLTWLHQADRSTLTTRPRDDPHRPPVGVFATRSPDRPNPIGLHEVEVTAVDEHGIVVDALEAVDGTPVLDVKCVLDPLEPRSPRPR